VGPRSSVQTVTVLVVLFHSMYGLRGFERSVAEWLRAAGHSVVLPDLFGGATVPGGIDAGLDLMGSIGWGTIVERARRAVADVPGEAVLAGFSMGVGVIGETWPERPDAAAVLCIHAPLTVPRGVRPGVPVQLHVGSDDPFAPDDQLTAFRESAVAVHARASVYEYPGAGHFFTDPTSPDHDAGAALSTWARVLRLLAVRDERVADGSGPEGSTIGGTQAG